MLFLRKRGNVFGWALECLRFHSVVLTAGTLWRRLGGKGGGFFLFCILRLWDRRDSHWLRGGSRWHYDFEEVSFLCETQWDFCLMLLEVQEGSQSLCKLGKSSMWSWISSSAVLVLSYHRIQQLMESESLEMLSEVLWWLMRERLWFQCLVILSWNPRDSEGRRGGMSSSRPAWAVDKSKGLKA